MGTPRLDFAKTVGNSIESEASISLAHVLAAVRLRRRILVFCVVLTPLIALCIATRIPLNYKSTAKLLIRSDSGLPGLIDQTDSGRATLSPQSTMEMISSIPVVARMIEKTGVQSADVARPAYKILFGYVLKPLIPFLPKEKSAAGAGALSPSQSLAVDVKTSIKTSLLQAEVRSARQMDDVVEITIASTNKQLVAPMVNGLVDAFIDEYAARTEQEAQLALANLRDQEKRLRESIAHATDDEAGGQWQPSQSRPLAEGLGREMGELQLRLIEAERTFAPNAPEVIRLREQLQESQTALRRQESLDALRDQLGTLTLKERQARINLELAQSRQTGLSFLEQGTPPRGTAALAVLRYAVPLIAGLFFGLLIGLASIVVLTAFDSRIRTKWDVKSATGEDLFGELSTVALSTAQIDGKSAAIPAVVRRIVAQLEFNHSGPARFVAVASADRDEASVALATLIARALSGHPSKKVLLVHTAGSATSAEGGFSELINGRELSTLIHATKTPNLQVLERGSIAPEFVICKTDLSAPWKQLSGAADFVVLDVGPLIRADTSDNIVQLADYIVLVVPEGATRASALTAADARARACSGQYLGTVLVNERGSKDSDA